MKRLITILFLFSIGYGQGLIPRSPAAVTPEDARLYTQYNFRPPVFSDTVDANLHKGIDSLGSLINIRNTKIILIRIPSTGTIHRWDTLQGSGNGGGSYTADETSIHLASTIFGIKSTWPGQSSINTVGNIVNGTWQSTAIADAFIASSPVWNAKQTSVLTSAKLWAGSGSNVATEVAPSGDLTMNNTGVFTLSSVVAGGSCTNCNVTFDAKGRATSFSNGTSGGGGNPFADNVALIKNNSDNTRLAIISASLVPTATTNTYNLPAAPGTFDLTNNTATLTNKTISGSSNTFSNIANASLVNSTISGVSLGNTLFTHIPGYGFTGSNYTGAASQIWILDTASAHGAASKDYVDARNPYTYFTYSDLTLGTVNIDSLYSGGFLGRDAHHSGSNLYDHYYDSTDLYYKPRSGNPVNADSSANKVMVWNTTTHKMMPSYWPATGGKLTRQNITSGTSATVTGGNYLVTFNFPTTTSAYTLTLPASPSDQDRVVLQAGGTLTFGDEVTTFSVAANSGQSIIGVPPTRLTVADKVEFVYNSSLTTWFIQ